MSPLPTVFSKDLYCRHVNTRACLGKGWFTFSDFQHYFASIYKILLVPIAGGLPPEGQIKQPILVTTAHMHWDPEFSDVKLIQTMMLMSELKKIIEDSHRSLKNLPPTIKVDCNSIPVILCGDLNSLPNSGMWTLVYPITRRQILDSSKLKEFADDYSKFNKKWQKAIQTGSKHCGKRRNCSLWAISPFPTVFSKGLLPRGVKRCHCVGMG